ncbi:Bromodomain-containing protein 3 [Sarcoptes scabiei]|uniref:Bromodomain-containing protein 3 n=1 Tax=Sarcoptes scabiei TaxID=52283 RepID=A0A132A7N2_SARSC|nr:Bromodomain-containing protein 3 [Sarcoptes scabiei]
MFEKDFDPLSIPQPSSPSPSPASPPLSVSISNQKKAKKSQLQQLLFALFKQIQKKDPKKFFARPVSDQIAPGYFTIITHPMDLSTVKRKILDEYQCLNDFRLDIKLMCDNAMRYNRPDTIYYRTADRLWQYVANKLLKSTAISKYIKRYPNISVTELRIPSLECGTIDSNKIIKSSRSDDDSKFLKPLDPINLFVTSNETLTDFGKTTSSILQQKPKSTLSQSNSSSRKNFDCKSQTKPHSNDYQSNIRSKSSQSSFSSMPSSSSSSSSSTSTSSSSSNESKLISIKTKSSVESFQLISSVSIENSSNTINSVSSRDVQHLTSNQSQQNKSHNQFLMNVTKSNSHSNKIKSHENRNDLFGSRSNNDSCSLSSSTTSLSSLISSSTLDKSISNSTNLIDSNQIKSTNKNKSSHQDLNRKSTLKISKKICEEKNVNNQNVRNKIVPEERFDGYSLGAFLEQIQLAAQKAQENLRKSKRKAYLTYLKRTSEYLNPYLHTIDCQSISMYRQPLIKEFQWEEFFAKRNDCREILTEPISNHSTINANCLGFSNTNPISEVKENTTISKNDTKSVAEEKLIIEEEKKTAKMDEGEEKSDIFALETQELEQMREQLRSHYGSEDFGIDYASSILNFSRNSNYAESLTNSLLTILTDGEHRSKSTELQKYVERFFAYDFDQDDTLIDTKAIVSN